VGLADAVELAVAVGDVDAVGSPVGDGTGQVGEAEGEADGDAEPDGDGVPDGDFDGDGFDGDAVDGRGLVGVADCVGLAVVGVGVGDGWAVRVGLMVGPADLEVGRLLGDDVVPGLFALLAWPCFGAADLSAEGSDPAVGRVASGPGSAPVCRK